MQSIFSSATTEAERLYSLDTYFMIAALLVLLLVAGLATYFSLKYRYKPGDPDPEQTSSSIKTELALVGGPTLLILAFFFLTIRTTRAVLPPTGVATPAVRVTGHQWWWQASYPGTHVQTANEIHLPVGKPLLIEVTPADYARWLQAAAQPAAAPDGALAQAGSALFARYACSSCHQIRGTAAHGQQGPDLTHFGSRQTMLAGLLPNNERNLTHWLTDPQAVKPGAHMPRFLFAPDSVRALTAYLSHLK